MVNKEDRAAGRRAAAIAGDTQLFRLLARRARDDDYGGFEAWCLLNGYEPAEHHDLIIAKLEAVERGEIDRLMFFMPPGSAKSTYASVLFPPWFLGRMRQKNIITASYSSRLSARFGKKARNIVGSNLFRQVFGFGLADDAKAKDEWETEAEGEFTATSVDGAVTGRRGDLILVDDPIKGRKEADSELVRNTCWEWWTVDLATRLKPGGAIVLIQTRWHEDDIAGRILPTGYDGQSGTFQGSDGETWVVVSIRAEAEKDDILGRLPGEMLWPEWFKGDMLAKMKRKLGQRDWDALYQQRPKPIEGAILKRSYWGRWTAPDWPQGVYYVLASLDGAFTAKDENDCSAMTVWLVYQAETGRTRILLRYGWEERLEFPELVELVKDTCTFFGVDRLIVENKASGKPVVQELRRRYPDMSIVEINPTSDKVARAHAVTPILEEGAVLVPEDVKNNPGKLRPWAQLVVDRCAAFPNARLKDVVDTVTQALRYIRDQGVELFPEDEPEPPPAVERRVRF